MNKYNSNPFTLMYGMSSGSVISREENKNTILNSFLNTSSMYMYLITGIRGSGKTVLLREINNQLSNKDDWINIDINSQGKILTSLANRLFNESKSKKLLSGWNLSINLPYLTLTKENEKITDSEIIAEEIIKKIIKSNKKILITIDEVTNTSDFKEFVNFYQHLLGINLPIYLLMTGLQENINSIINDKAMTFLSRAPKIMLEPLDLPTIALEYQQIFDIEQKEAIKMAKLTNGYAFAYQVLGYLFYENKKVKVDSDLLKKYDSYLWSNGYNKFWNDLTKNEKEFVIGMALSNTCSKEEIIANSAFSENNFSQYRRRLLEKGLIVSTGHNKLSFVLPRFKEYILFVKEFED